METVLEQVPLETVIPGALLGEDVLDGNGNVLLSMGAVLEERHLAMLRKRGIEQVAVAGDKEDGADAATAAATAQDESKDLSEGAAARVEEVNRLFRDSLDDEVLSAIHNIALKYARMEGGV